MQPVSFPAKLSTTRTTLQSNATHLSDAMTTIIVTHENNELDEYDFDTEMKTITVGRRSTNDVCVAHLSVSGNHCRILLTDSGTYVEDLGSTNGTYIDGRLISKQLLNDGDDIVIGKARLTFLQPEGTTKSAPSSNDNQNATNQIVNDEPVSATGKAAALAGEIPQHAAAQDSIKSEFAGDYYEPDEAEIAAMIDSPSVVDDDDFDPADAGLATAEQPQQKRAVAANAVSGGLAGGSNAYDYELETSNEPQLDTGAIIEIKNGAKSGQVLPIDKPVTTLGRPGIQIAAIMKKPEGYFLMHIESEDRTDRPRLNDSMIGDDPVLLSSGDSLNVAGIDVQFMLS